MRYFVVLFAVAIALTTGVHAGERGFVVVGYLPEHRVAAIDPQRLAVVTDVVHFNGKATVAAKIDLAIQTHLGGMMIWELGQDAEAAGRSGLTIST